MYRERDRAHIFFFILFLQLAKAITAQWGSVDAFKTEFNTKTAAVQVYLL
jgi:hypothetical protein